MITFSTKTLNLSNISIKIIKFYIVFRVACQNLSPQISVTMNSGYVLTLSTLGKTFSRRDFETFVFSYFSKKTKFDILMQIVSNEDNLHEMSNSVF